MEVKSWGTKCMVLNTKWISAESYRNRGKGWRRNSALFTHRLSYRYRSAKGRERRSNYFPYIVEQLQIQAEVTLTAEVSDHWPANLLFTQYNLLSTVSASQINLAVAVTSGWGLIFFSDKQLMFAYFRSLHKQILFKCWIPKQAEKCII